MKFVETVTIDWKNYHKIEVSTDMEKCISKCVKNIRLVKPEGTPDSFEIRYSEHNNLDETLYCEDFPVYRYFHKFTKLEYLPFTLNKTGIYETIEITTNCETDFSGKLRYDIYEINEIDPKIPDEILISRYDKMDGNAISFIRKKYKDESKQYQDRIDQDPLQLSVGEETHLISYTRFIRKAVNLAFYLYEIKEDDPELYLNLVEIKELPKDVFAFAIVKTHN
jgi:hypothetical protein